MLNRRKTRQISVGDVLIGGGAPIAIQSMTNTDTADVAATLTQIRRLAAAGCDIVRLTVPDEKAAAALSDIITGSPVPLIADIHFDYQLALAALDKGIAGLRINPGNIGGLDKVRLVARAAKERGVPIRIGVNSGSLSREILAKNGGVTAAALVESAMQEIAALEAEGFYDIKISLKASMCRSCWRLTASWPKRWTIPFISG